MASAKKTTAQEMEKKWTKVLRRATTDEAFKKKLMQNPAKTLAENGIDLAPNTQLKVVENTSKVHYLILPEAEMAKDLSDEQLRQVSGGCEYPFPESGATGIRGQVRVPPNRRRGEL